MSRTPAGRRVALGIAAVLMGLAGCSDGVETGYGRSRSKSINGTGVLAGLFRERGHSVRVAVRLTDDLSDWADVIVRFAPRPGAPARDEAEWYGHWLDGRNDRRLVYVPYDYNAGPDYWRRARDQLPKSATPRLRERIDQALTESRNWPDHLPNAPKELAAEGEWFGVEVPGQGTKPGHVAHVCKSLGGPWARGVDREAAALVRDEALKVLRFEHVLLTGDDEPLVISWPRPNDSRVLVPVSGTFLLNGALAANPARRPLASRLVAWSGYSGEEDEGSSGVVVPKRVAFVEGAFVTAARGGNDSIFDLIFRNWVFRVVYAQFLVLGLAAALVRALRLRQPPRDDTSGADRPVAHPEALGALLARTSQTREARSLLEAYRRWRFGPSARGHTPPAGGVKP